MKIIEHLDRAHNKELLCSYEIVPPPRGRSVQDIIEIVEALQPYNPPWIDVTSHAAGAFYNEKSDGSIERKVFKKRPGTIGICGIIQNRFNIDTCVHLLSLGFTKEETEDALIELNFLGIHNVLALRGDAPNYNKKIDTGRHTNKYAIDLVKQINGIKKGEYVSDISGARPLDFCTGVAGYPEKHFEAPNMNFDIKMLKAKVDAGAEYITTQMFFDNSKYFSFVKECRDAGITVPIIPGIKIIKNVNQLSSIPKHFYVDFPNEFVDEIMDNQDHVKDIGLEWAKKQCQELADFGVPCLHFYIMNDTKSVIEVVKSFR